MFTVYLDESGIGRDIFAIGGFVGSNDEWAIFSDEWDAVLKREGITSYHAADCEGGFGEFKGWNQERRVALTKEFVSCICRRNVFAVGWGTDVKEYQSNTNVEPRYLYSKLYAECFKWVVAVAMNTLAQREPNKDLAIVCDRQDEFDGAAHRVYEEMIFDQEWDVRHKLISLTYASRSQHSPLQAADICAYETYKMVHNKLFDPTRPARMSMYRIFDKQFYGGKIILW